MFNRGLEYDGHIRKTPNRFMSSADDSLTNRRPLTSRSPAWARFLANGLVRAGLAPNPSALIRILFAGVGARLLLCTPNGVGLSAPGSCVQLRLLCTLPDAMVAIDGKRQSPTGALYNETPDRLADSLFSVALGYAIASP